MILSAQTIRKLRLVEPLAERTLHEKTGTTYGLSGCGYDITLDQDIRLMPGEFELASAAEYFRTPDFLCAIVHDKSTWARRGLAVQNTVIEPGWMGYLTLELTNHGNERLTLPAGTPIAQVVWHQLDESTEQPYVGKYQRQERGPQRAK